LKTAPPLILRYGAEKDEEGRCKKRQKRRAAAGKEFNMVAGSVYRRPTNKASIGRKAALGLRQIAALMAPSVSTQSQSLLRAPSCRQCGNFLRLSNVGRNKPSQNKIRKSLE